MKHDLFMPVMTFLFGCLCLTMWWVEMFSESRLAHILRSMTKPSLRGKNWSAIGTPAFSLVCVDVGLMSIGEEAGISRTLYSLAVYVSLLLVLIILVGLLPIKFPRWVYADWQYAKRHGLLDEKGNIDREAWERHEAGKKDDPIW